MSRRQPGDVGKRDGGELAMTLHGVGFGILNIF